MHLLYLIGFWMTFTVEQFQFPLKQHVVFVIGITLELLVFLTYKRLIFWIRLTSIFIFFNSMFFLDPNDVSSCFVVWDVLLFSTHSRASSINLSNLLQCWYLYSSGEHWEWNVYAITHLTKVTRYACRQMWCCIANSKTLYCLAVSHFRPVTRLKIYKLHN